MSAEDFARTKRKKLFLWLGAAVVVILLGAWIYGRSSGSQEVTKALNDGEQLFKANRYAEAIQSFDRAVALNHDQTRAYLLRGRASAALGQMEPAIRDFTKVIELKPSSAEAYVERASVHLRANNYAKAAADCGDALAKDPKLTYAYTLRGMALREMGDYPRALQDFNRAVELAPGLDNYFQRATAYQALGDHAKAIADLDEVIALFPASPMGYLARAKSRAAMGDTAGAHSDREAGRRLEEREN